MTIKYFDTLEYVRKAKELKDPEALAEYQVKQMEAAIETAVQQPREEVHENSKELTTKADLSALELRLRKEIEEIRKEIAEIHKEIGKIQYEMLRYIIRTGIGVVVVLGGMMAHGFHWI